MTTEPRRMLFGGAGDDVSALLGSARDDGPSAADRRAVAAALGFATVVAVTAAASSATAATAASTSVAPAALVATGSAASSATAATTASVGLHAATGKLGALALLKLGGAFALTLSVGVAVGVRVERARARSEVAASVASAANRTSRAPTQRAVALASPADTPDSQAVDPIASAAPSGVVARPPVARATAPAPSARSASAAEPAVTPAPAASMLAQETVLLDRARKAVARHAYVDAIAALDAYDVLAPSGVLVQEARALRVQACADQGRRLAALDLGRAFLAEFPTSPYAKRVKTIVDGLDATSSP